MVMLLHYMLIVGFRINDYSGNFDIVDKVRPEGQKFRNPLITTPIEQKSISNPQRTFSQLKGWRNNRTQMFTIDVKG